MNNKENVQEFMVLISKAKYAVLLFQTKFHHNNQANLENS